jgi:pimeloyl-ACP methyl ester carboxylesterase
MKMRILIYKVKITQIFLMVIAGVFYSQVLHSEQPCAPENTPFDELKMFSGELDAAVTSETVSNQSIAKSLKLWNKYVESIDYKLQKNCKPKHYAPPLNVPVRGTVVLHHGFTACPLQYFELANSLAAKGYHVFLPLMPGQGRAENDGSQFEFLPGKKAQGWKRYDEYSKTIDSIMEVAPGKRIVGGLSVGGAVALNSAINRQDVYDRALVKAPFLALPQSYPRIVDDNERSKDKSFANASGRRIKRFFQNIVPNAKATFLAGAKHVPGVGNIDKGWGDECLDENKHGRAGICEFKIEHLMAADSFGRDVTRKYRSAKMVKNSIQIVGVENDPAANTEPTRAVIRKLEQSNNRSGGCFMDSKIPHAFLSKFENRGVNMYWLPTVNRQFTNYMADGTPIPKGGKSKLEKPFFKCRSK